MRIIAHLISFQIRGQRVRDFQASNLALNRKPLVTVGSTSWVELCKYDRFRLNNLFDNIDTLGRIFLPDSCLFACSLGIFVDRPLCIVSFNMNRKLRGIMAFQIIV